MSAVNVLVCCVHVSGRIIVSMCVYAATVEACQPVGITVTRRKQLHIVIGLCKYLWEWDLGQSKGHFSRAGLHQEIGCAHWHCQLQQKPRK